MLAWVTGGTGLVGATLIARLLDQGHRVVALARPGSENRLPKGTEVVSGILPDISVFRTAPRADVVFHCAAVIDGPRAEQEAVNVESTVRLSQVATGARFVHLSTTDIYPTNNASTITEATEAKPEGAYGETKLEGERRLLALRPDAIVLRPPGVYGPRAPRCIVLHTARRIERSRFFFVGDGRAVRSWVFVENLVDAMLHLAVLESARGVYLVDDGHPISRVELTSEIAHAMGLSSRRFPHLPKTLALTAARMLGPTLALVGKPAPLTVTGVRYAVGSLVLDTTKLRRTGLPAPLPTGACVERTIAWGRSVGALSAGDPRRRQDAR